MKTGNPALNTKAFEIDTAAGVPTMTIQGAVNKTGISLLILFMAASWTWGSAMSGHNPTPLMLLGLVGGFITALVTIFKKHLAPITTPIYAVLEGLALGGLSAVFERQYPGIVSQAVMLTFGTLLALLVAYKAGVRPSENFKLGIVAATGGIALVYLVNIVMGFFGASIPFVHQSGILGIGFSVFVVIIAALNLVLDFDFIEQGAACGVPKYMEWYGAFGLLVTLIWLYLEILRLLAKLQRR
ncbi:MAG: Bax inhibitor-1/YccA family protein [Candidatus Omnitrophota bacterium]|jgi:uncharacterized YccA/Bax inhibitor family protein